MLSTQCLAPTLRISGAPFLLYDRPNNVLIVILLTIVIFTFYYYACSVLCNLYIVYV
jgi:hypothetical protein